MSEIKESQADAQKARRRLRDAEETWYTNRNRLRNKQSKLIEALRLGAAGGEEATGLNAEIQDLQDRVGNNKGALDNVQKRLGSILENFPDLNHPWRLVRELDDNLPFLLLPVRIETRFMTVKDGIPVPPNTVDAHKELWVRIFPDDIAVHTHEKTLTPDELVAGKTYWQEVWKSEQEEEEEEEKQKQKKEAIKRGAWRALAGAFGGTRAAWIARETKPTTLEVDSVDKLEFSDAKPGFDPETLKQESWSRAPRSHVMPDRFVVMTFDGDTRIDRKVGNLIPDPLMLGPDPLKPEDEYQQVDGDLKVGEDIRWIYDFDRAVKVGMGIKIPLSPPHDTRGFDRLLVLGLRLSTDALGNQRLLEDLIENHHYSPDGMSLLPQGTPTNNTDAKGSGFSSTDPGAETSYAVERGKALFELTGDKLAKSDGQRLAEALDINHELLQHIRFADQHDVGEAMAMNKALWHGTLGYYLEEMLEIEPDTVDRIHEFSTDYVTARGPLPAIRVGTQPYGILLTSDFSRWEWSAGEVGDLAGFFDGLGKVMAAAERQWEALVKDVPHIGSPGDPFKNLLSLLGLHAASVEYHRRHALGKWFIWNYGPFVRGKDFGWDMRDSLLKQPQRETDWRKLQALGFTQPLPSLFDLAFFQGQDQVMDPLVDDIPAGEREKLAEEKGLKSEYLIPNASDPTNYVGWLANTPLDNLKKQTLQNSQGEVQPVPRPLLYRMLRGALLLAYYETARELLASELFKIPRTASQREVEFSNIGAKRTAVTRWEFLEADLSQLVVNWESKYKRAWEYVQYLLRSDDKKVPKLRQVLDGLEALTSLPTARLERILTEHLDLCGYRLDAWQTACFNLRLQKQRRPPVPILKRPGIYLGAFGWLEDVRPEKHAQVKENLPPSSLHDPAVDGLLYEQPGNQGYIHGPSINHAVAAAVLRSAYRTHLEPKKPAKMAVNLSSERVRTALAFLEGIRNGQELGALLGYQFERGLHDRHNGSLNQYTPYFRKRYPLVADKITPDADGEQIETKEARNVLDGYALLEAVFWEDGEDGDNAGSASPTALNLEKARAKYNFGIPELPADKDAPDAKAIIAEVGRMADTLDGIADLALAEGVYQVTQGNYDRAGAMMKAITEGSNPPEPEIVKTPRSGTVLTQRLNLHFETGNDVAQPWPGALTPRARMEPGLSKWLGERLPPPDKIQFIVQLGGSSRERQDVRKLGLQPIDLVYMISDELASEATELEGCIAYVNKHDSQNDNLGVKIEFGVPPPDQGTENLFEPDGVPLFQALPLLRSLRELVTGTRPLAAYDLTVPSETPADPDGGGDPTGYDLSEMAGRLEEAIMAFDDRVKALDLAIDASAAGPLRDALRRLVDFGVPDALPRSAFGDTDETAALLREQGKSIKVLVDRRSGRANDLKTKADDGSLAAELRVAMYRKAAQEIFGPAFNLIPLFELQNKAEAQAAVAFRDAPSDSALTRFHQDNPHLVDEWLQGVGRVREKVGMLETIDILGEAFTGKSLGLKPLQLPYRETDHWVAVEYPEVKPDALDEPDVFVPQGDFLSIVQVLPAGSFDAGQRQSGLLIDEWTEVIPSKQETTGIAFHYDQPSSEPPQALLLAVTPKITGRWEWNDLVGILHDTLDRAKRRAVEPDQLGNTVYGHLLPAVLSAVSSRPFATISTDFVHQSAMEAIKLAAEHG